MTLHREALQAAVSLAGRSGTPEPVLAAALRREPLSRLGRPAHLSADDLLSALTLVAVHAAVPCLFSELDFIAEHAPPEQLLSQQGFVLTTLQVREGRGAGAGWRVEVVE